MFAYTFTDLLLDKYSNPVYHATRWQKLPKRQQALQCYGIGHERVQISTLPIYHADLNNSSLTVSQILQQFPPHLRGRVRVGGMLLIYQQVAASPTP